MNDQVDERWPFCGPCALCGHADARHRVLDAIRSRVRAGEEIGQVAVDYGATVALVEAVVALDAADGRLGASETALQRLPEQEAATAFEGE